MPPEIIVGGVIELIKLGAEALEAYNNGDDAKFKEKWAAMQTRGKAIDDAWVASKKAQGQT